MARPDKQGLDYYPKDIDADRDDKLSMIIAEFGCKGEMLFDKLCGWIYKHKGYYVEWDEKEQLKFLSRYSYCGFSVSFINEVVPRCIKWGLFDETVFNMFQILTSVRIQKTWVDASRKRTGRKIVKNYWLIEVSGGLKAEEIIKKAEETPQSKVKKSKVNEIKVEGAKAPVGEEAPTGVKKSDYEKLLTDLQNKDLKTVISALKEFLSKRPSFPEPYMEYWNIAVKGCNVPSVKQVTDSRIKQLKVRLKEDGFDFVEIIKQVHNSSKLKNDSSWFSFDWIFENDKNYVKILEGNYGN
jgi:Domain of unknown function (DUF4373)